jgi:hypothetical protein
MRRQARKPKARDAPFRDQDHCCAAKLPLPLRAVFGGLNCFYAEFSGCLDVQPYANREPAPELFGRILGVFAVNLDCIQKQVLLKSFRSDCLDLSKLSICCIELRLPASRKVS